jgi:hypothetical protein
LNNLDAIIRWMYERDDDVQLVIGRGSFLTGRPEWTAALHSGKEAEDSPMWGAASYGISATVDGALATLVDEFHISTAP